MGYDALARAQTRLEAFDGDRWGNQLDEVQAQVAGEGAGSIGRRYAGVQAIR